MLAAEPVLPPFLPSFQDWSMRRRLKMESTWVGCGIAVTLIVSLADVIVAAVGIAAATPNLSNARLREAGPLKPAVVPATRVEFPPRLLTGSRSNKVVSATGMRVTVSAQSVGLENRAKRIEREQ